MINPIKFKGIIIILYTVKVELRQVEGSFRHFRIESIFLEENAIRGIEGHKAILARLKQRDLKGVEKAIRQHLEQSKRDIRRYAFPESQEKDYDLHWHWPHGEFFIRFEKDLDTPLEDGTYEKESTDHWIKTKVKIHEDTKGYVYEVGEKNPVGEQKKADPGLIVDP